jgi:hypothetical protein
MTCPINTAGANHWRGADASLVRSIRTVLPKLPPTDAIHRIGGHRCKPNSLGQNPVRSADHALASTTLIDA